jgi:hypothetical protein
VGSVTHLGAHHDRERRPTPLPSRPARLLAIAVAEPVDSTQPVTNGESSEKRTKGAFLASKTSALSGNAQRMFFRERTL